MSEVLPFVQAERKRPTDLRNFAYGCEKIGLHDIAAHAFWKLLRYEDDNTDEIMTHHLFNLKKLGLDSFVSEIDPNK